MPREVWVGMRNLIWLGVNEQVKEGGEVINVY